MNDYPFPVLVVASLAIVSKDDVSGLELKGAIPYGDDLLFPITQDNIFMCMDKLGVDSIFNGKVQYPNYHFAIGGWNCERSPYRKCIYDHKRDSSHDFCLICGNPEERK